MYTYKIIKKDPKKGPHPRALSGATPSNPRRSPLAPPKNLRGLPVADRSVFAPRNPKAHKAKPPKHPPTKKTPSEARFVQIFILIQQLMVTHQRLNLLVSPRLQLTHPLTAHPKMTAKCF